MEDKTKELRGQQGEEIANSKNRMNKIIEKGILLTVRTE